MDLYCCLLVSLSINLVEMAVEFDFSYRIFLIGDSGVGKSVPICCNTSIGCKLLVRTKNDLVDWKVVTTPLLESTRTV